MFSLSHTTRLTPPALPFKKMKDDILGESYALSLVFVGDKKSRALNYAYRRKTYVPNVLSFPLDKRSGEIYINPHRASIEAKQFGMSVRGFIGYLFIHGLLHLEGHLHGDTMEQVEARYKNRYGLR
jgi:probable rRNA maturation factor